MKVETTVEQVLGKEDAGFFPGQTDGQAVAVMLLDRQGRCQPFLGDAERLAHGRRSSRNIHLLHDDFLYATSNPK